MRRVSKTLAGALAVFALAVGLVACGGGGDGSGSTTAGSGSQATSESPAASPESEGTGGASSGKGSGQEGSASESREAAEFVPKQHHDSGGGSTPYKTKGGDNSVQEFGAEAESSDFEAAAAALHDFLDARAEQNWAATCGYVSKKIIGSLEKLAEQAKKGEGLGCAGILGKLINPAAGPELKEEAAQANVRSVRSEGSSAFVIYTGVNGTVFSMPMVSEGGSWKVSTLAGVPLS